MAADVPARLWARMLAVDNRAMASIVTGVEKNSFEWAVEKIGYRLAARKERNRRESNIQWKRVFEVGLEHRRKKKKICRAIAH